jgi:amino acid adenylation domain-containing protein
LFRELAALYERPGESLPELTLSFRDYWLHEQALRATPSFARAREYWMARVPELPPAPALPLETSPSAIRAPRFTRCLRELSTDLTHTLKARAREIGTSHTGLLLAAYAEILARWCASPRFTLNIPLLNRLPVHPQVDAVVGPFSTVGLLAVDASSPEPFDVRARRIQDQLLEDLAHRQFDGVNVQRELARQRGASEAAMPVVFTGLLDHDFQNSVSRLGQVVSAVNQTAQVWMDLHVDEQAGAFVFKLDTVEGLFPAGLAEAMLDTYCRLLERVAAGDLQPDAESLLPRDQLERRRQGNATAPAVVGLAHAGFREQAQRQPDHPAVIAGERTLSYAELFERATRIGRRLREAGVRPDQLVAVAMDKGWEQVAGALGVLESGAAYLPVDAELPAERFQHLLAHGEVRIALTQERLLPTLAWPPGIEVLCVDRDAEWAGVSAEPLLPAQQPEHLAYVLYTSGSTGLPKGAMIEHRSVANRMADVIRRFGMGPADRVMAVTALHHDLSVFDLFAGLGAGATLVVPDAAQRRDPAHWAELVERHGITLWNSVPAFVEMLVEYLEHAKRPQAARSLRRVMLSGDWVPVSLPDRLRALSPRTEVTSLGGPTETTVWDIWYPIGAVDPGWKSIPYGKPLDAARYFVLDANLEPRPDWATGELYIAGAGLARGYWRDPEKTAEKFVTHPKTGERLYRSGDLGRYRPDGNLEFMGRADFQVKIQGQRIELGEIEAALRQHPWVTAVVASAVDDPAGRKALAAWLVGGAGAGPADAELRDFLAAKLPRHMVPAAFVRLEKLPLTPNGKVDRRNLPDPFEGRDAGPGEAAPAGELEAKIGALAQEVLRLPALAADASFIGQGANSIDLVRLGNRLEAELGERPRIDEMFRLDSVRALAAYYEKRRGGRPTASGAGSAGLVDSEVAALVASYRVLLDPGELDAFKAAQHGIRRGDPGRRLPLAGAPDEAAYRVRGSWRRYSLRPVPFELFSRWLGCLRQLEIGGNPKYLYGSAGGLYPNQVYLHVKPGRVEGVAAGTWYYQPVDHALVELEPGAELPREIHIPFVNQPVFDEAAFSVFVVAQVAAIAPGYGEHSIRFAAIEAGLMSQLLETASLGTGIGLCSIGSVDFERVRALFHLERSHVLVHNLVGGWIGDGDAPAPEATTSATARAARLAERIRDLSPEQVAALLRASRTDGSGGADA